MIIKLKKFLKNLITKIYFQSIFRKKVVYTVKLVLIIKSRGIGRGI